MKILKNEHGVYTLDESGTLLHFEYIPRAGWSTDGIPNRNGGLNITELMIPEGVCALQENAFRGYCIHTAVLPDSLTHLGAGAFSRCDIHHLTLPPNLRLDSTAFAASKISSLTLPEDAHPMMLLQLGHALRFSFTWWLDSMIASLPEVCQKVFRGQWASREQWQRIHNESGTFFVDADGVLMEHQPPADCPTGTLPSLLIPGGIKAIDGSLFHNITVHGSLSLPPSLRVIGSGDQESCFTGCTLAEVTLPQKLELLGVYSFGSCRIGCLTIPESFVNSCISIGARQFKSSHIDKIRVAPAYEDVLQKTFQYCHRIVFYQEEDPLLGRLSCAALPGGDRHERLGDQIVELLAYMTAK